MSELQRDATHDEQLTRFFTHALNAPSGIDFRIACLALEAYQEIKDMANAARSEVDAILGIPEAF